MPSLAFNEVQSGDPIRITLKDGVTTLDATFRKFVGNENTIICTTPVGENDPTQQATYYIDDYTSFVSPIPPSAIATDVDAFQPGDAIEVRWVAGGSGSVSGTFVSYDPRSGIIQVDDGAKQWLLKDFWYARQP